MPGPLPVTPTVLGIAKEATPGTPTVATDFIPVTKLTGRRNIAELMDQGWRGSMAEDYGMVQGPWTGEINISGAVFADTIPYFLAALLGLVSTSAAPGAVATTLSGATIVGAATLNAAATAAVGQNIVVDTGVLAEMRTVTAVAGAGPYTLTLNYPLSLPHVAGVAVASVGAANVHAISLNNSTANRQPTTYSLTVGYVAGTRLFPYCVCKSLQLTFNADGVLTYTAQFISRAEASVAAPVPSFSTVPMVPVWQSTVTLLGLQTFVTSGDINFTRGVKAIHAMWGLQDPVAVWGDQVGVKGKLNMIMESDSVLNNYLTNTQGVLDINFLTGLPSVPASVTQLRLLSSKAALTTPTEPQPDAEFMKLAAAFTMMGNGTDMLTSGLSPCRVTAQTAKPANTYA